MQTTVQHSIEPLHRLTVDLCPPDMSSRQLPESIASLAETLRTQDVALDPRIEPLPQLDKDLVTTLNRVAHEGLTNVAEHAEASSVDVSLATNAPPESEGKMVRLQIADDGVGFDTSKLDRRSILTAARPLSYRR